MRLPKRLVILHSSLPLGLRIKLLRNNVVLGEKISEKHFADMKRFLLSQLTAFISLHSALFSSLTMDPRCSIWRRVPPSRSCEMEAFRLLRSEKA